MSTPRLTCRSCGATWLSAEAQSLMLASRRCLRCDGELTAAGSRHSEIARRFFDAVNDADEAALAETVAEQVTVRAAVRLLGHVSPEMNSLDDARQALRSLGRNYRGWAYAIGRIVDHGDGRLFCEGGFSVTRHDGGTESRAIFWAIRIREDRIVLLAGFERAEEAWAALELPSVPDARV